MGNCLVIQDRKDIKIMNVDGSEVLKMPSPGSDASLTTSRRLPVKAPAAAAVVVDPAGAAVRVKLVISKQELKKMLDKEGMGMSLDDMVSLMRKDQQANDDREQEECCGGWRPALESIPEGRDL